MRQHGLVELRAWRETLDERDRQVVAEALRAATEGPFFPDWEFSILFGLSRDEVRRVSADWPETNDTETELVAVEGAMNNLLGYPHGKDAAFPNYMSVDRAELELVYWRIKEATGTNDRIRRELARDLRAFAQLPPEQLPSKLSFIRDVVGLADRYGVDVPKGVRDLTNHP